MSNEARDYDSVNCPNCRHQFRALSDSDKEEIAQLEAENAKLKKSRDKHKAIAKKETDLVETLLMTDELEVYKVLSETQAALVELTEAVKAVVDESHERAAMPSWYSNAIIALAALIQESER